MNDTLLRIADELDAKGKHDLADAVDAVIKSMASDLDDWDAGRADVMKREYYLAQSLGQKAFGELKAAIEGSPWEAFEYERIGLRMHSKNLDDLKSQIEQQTMQVNESAYLTDAHKRSALEVLNKWQQYVYNVKETLSKQYDSPNKHDLSRRGPDKKDLQPQNWGEKAAPKITEPSKADLAKENAWSNYEVRFNPEVGDAMLWDKKNNDWVVNVKENDARDGATKTAAGRPKAPLRKLDDDVKKDLMKFLTTVKKNMEESVDALEELFRRMRYFDIDDMVKELGLDKVIKDMEKTNDCMDNATKTMYALTHGKKPSKSDMEQMAEDFGLKSDPRESPLEFFDRKKPEGEPGFDEREVEMEEERMDDLSKHDIELGLEPDTLEEEQRAGRGEDAAYHSFEEDDEDVDEDELYSFWRGDDEDED